MELVDTRDLKSLEGNFVPVRVRPRAPLKLAMREIQTEEKRTIWILVYTKAKQEFKANKNLKNQGFKTFLPLISATNKDIGKRPLEVIFPGYIFVQIRLLLDNWTAIKSTYGVSHIVTYGEGLSSVPNDLINLLQNKLNEEDVYERNILHSDFEEGDALKIKDGRLAGIYAIFLSNKSKDRVRLLLKFFKTTVISELDKSDIGRKEVIKTFKF